MKSIEITPFPRIHPPPPLPSGQKKKEKGIIIIKTHLIPRQSLHHRGIIPMGLIPRRDEMHIRIDDQWGLRHCLQGGGGVVGVVSHCQPVCLARLSRE